MGIAILWGSVDSRGGGLIFEKGSIARISHAIFTAAGRIPGEYLDIHESVFQAKDANNWVSTLFTVDIYGHLVPGANRQEMNRLPGLNGRVVSSDSAMLNYYLRFGRKAFLP